jgi:hypothetical protein
MGKIRGNNFAIYCIKGLYKRFEKCTEYDYTTCKSNNLDSVRKQVV